MSFDTIFFDLDSTLYPESNGLWQAIRQRIDLYMLEVLGFSQEEIAGIRQRFFLDHGTTLRGLQIHYDIDPVDYLNFVHDLPLHKYLKSDPELRQILLSIPYRRWIFTNADSAHANRVLNILGVSDCFEGMVDVMAMDPFCKPMGAAYGVALKAVGSTTPVHCALVDDSPRNLAPAKKMGFFTVLVGMNGNDPSADRSLKTIHELPKVVLEFWEK